MYSVSEILAIAGDPARQLPLLDKFEPAAIRALDQRIAEVERRLVVNSAHVGKLDEERAENATREAELPSVGAALEAMALAGADVSRAARTRAAQDRKIARGRERRAVAAMPEELAAARAALETVAADALHRLARSVEGDLERGPCGEAFARAHAAVHRVAGAIEAAAGRVREEVAAASSAIALASRAVEEVHAREEDEYHALVEVTLRRGEDRSHFQALLEEMLRGAHVRPTEAVASVARGVRPEDLVEIVGTGDVEALVRVDVHGGNKQARAEKILATLRKHPRLHELQTVPLGDLPLLTLQTDAGPIEVGRGSTGQRVLEVIDRGKGMSDGARATAFTPFKSDKPGGSGLGLMVARTMIEEVHDGSLTFESQRGAGTCMTLVVPARRAGARGASVRPEGAGENEKPKEPRTKR